MGRGHTLGKPRITGSTRPIMVYFKSDLGEGQLGHDPS